MPEASAIIALTAREERRIWSVSETNVLPSERILEQYKNLFYACSQSQRVNDHKSAKAV